MQSVKDLVSEVDEAMALYNLEQRRLFYDRTTETKVVVAWSGTMIVLCVRGSSTRVNFWQDAKVTSFLFSGALPIFNVAALSG